MNFPKHKWIAFEYETELFGESYMVLADGYIGDDGYAASYERPPEPTKVLVKKINIITENGRQEPHSPNEIEVEAIDSDAYEYFLINFVSNS